MRYPPDGDAEVSGVQQQYETLDARVHDDAGVEVTGQLFTDVVIVPGSPRGLAQTEECSQGVSPALTSHIAARFRLQARDTVAGSCGAFGIEDESGPEERKLIYIAEEQCYSCE